MFNYTLKHKIMWIIVTYNSRIFGSTNISGLKCFRQLQLIVLIQFLKNRTRLSAARERMRTIAKFREKTVHLVRFSPTRWAITN